jgi:hypothetical protein
MRWHRVLLAIGLGTAVFALDGPPAGADCSSPTIEYPAGPVDRGQAITVTGSAFGDNCYDTGPPPPGQGALGRPRDGIEIVITQAGDEHVVAEGGADADYGFEVDVVVPADLQPGEARLQARVVDPTGTVSVFDRTDQPLLVSDAAPPSAEVEVAIFGPAAGPSDTEPPDTGKAPAEAAAPREHRGGPDWGPWVVGALVVLGVVAGGSMLVVRRR